MGENLCPPFITNKVKQYCSRALPFFVSEFCNFLTCKSNLIYAMRLNLVITKIVYAFNCIYKLFWVEIASYCLMYYPRAVDLPLFVFYVGMIKTLYFDVDCWFNSKSSISFNSKCKEKSALETLWGNSWRVLLLKFKHDVAWCAKLNNR